MSVLTASAAWRALQAHAQAINQVSLNELFALDAGRAPRLSAEAVGLYLDYSKQRLSGETIELLLQLAAQQDMEGWIARLFAGDAVNHTEGRAAFHMALRAPREAAMAIAGRDVMPEVYAVRDRMRAFAEAVRGGAWTGASGERIRDVVNIGIGGSELGPRMVCEALAPFADGPRVHFVANVDGAQLHAVLARVRPETTLFVVASKTFGTQETMANACAAREWLAQALGEAAIPSHFVAVSTNADAVQRFGIAADHMFGFWDWVGGRYSLWSAVGLSILLALGPDCFDALLAGAHAMDEHFRSAPPAQNLPVLLGLIAVWNTNFLGSGDQVIAPYAQRLDKFVAWLQQLEMESNGKSVNRAGEPVDYATTPALWGDVGTNSQHAYFQMLHQGSAVHPVDFILVGQADHPYAGLNRLLLANGLAQSAALMQGKSAEEVRAELLAKGAQGEVLEAAIPHRVFAGNRPSNTLLLPRLDAYHLGALLALYEHRTFVMSVIWQINPFDQWGVELGKQLAGRILRVMDGEAVAGDASTATLLARLGLAG
jgi:glucose-6-phosphate isomerase